MILKNYAKMLLVLPCLAVLLSFAAFPASAGTNEAVMVVPEVASGAALVPFLYDFTNQRALFARKATCLTSYDKQAITFDVTVPFTAGYKPTGLNQRDGVIWNDDRIEVFLQANGTVCQFILNAVGALYDSADKNVGWNGTAECSVKLDADNWQAHIRVPFSDIGFDIAKGDTIKGNVAVTCNDPAAPYCITWTSVVLTFVDPSTFGTFKLSPSLPFVKSISVGDTTYDSAGAHVGVEYTVKNPAKSEQVVSAVSQKIVVPAGAEKTFSDVISLAATKTAVLGLSLGDSFSYKAEVTNNIVPAIELIALDPYRFEVKVRNTDVLMRFVDSLALAVDGKEILRSSLADLPDKVLSTKNWKQGNHKFEYTLISKDGKVFSKTSETIFTFKPNSSGYNISKLDASRYYTPVTFKGGMVAAAQSVFDLSKGILPSQITVVGRPVLEKPVQFIFDGKVLPTDGKVNKISSNKNQVRLVSESKMGDKTVTVKADHQYDGFTWYDVSIKSDTAFEYGPLDVVIPLKLDSDIIMSYEMQYYDELFGKDKITNIGAPTDIKGIEYNNKYISHGRLMTDGEKVTLPLTPWVSVATDTNEAYRGLGISCEGPTGWNLKNYNNTFQIARGDDGRVSLVAHISDGQTRWSTREIKFSFGLEPFPMHKFKNDHHAGYRLDSTFGPTCYSWPDKTIAGESMLFLDRLAKDGIKIEMAFENWTEWENYWEAGFTAPDIAKCVAAAKKAGVDLMFYFGFLISNKAPGFALYHDILLTKPTDYPSGGFNPYYYYKQGEPDQRAFGVCYNSIWGDRYAQGIGEHIKRYNTRGTYHDGTTVAAGCANLKHGCGVIDPYGRLICTFPVRAYRKVGEMIYNAGIKVRPDFEMDLGLGWPQAPAMGLMSGFWTAEASHLFEPICGRIAPDVLRGQLNGKLYGVGCDLIKRPEMDINACWAESLLVDAYPRLTVGAGRDFVIASKTVWDLYDKYNLTADTFTPYFVKNSKVVKDNPNIYTSYYDAKKAVVVVVSNYWMRQNETVTIDLSAFPNLKTKAHDAWFKEDFELQNGKATMNVPWGYMRLLVIEKQ